VACAAQGVKTEVKVKVFNSTFKLGSLQLMAGADGEENIKILEKNEEVDTWVFR
jgi:hypothetical protein